MRQYKNQVSYLSSGGGRNFFFVDVSGSLSAGGGGSRSKLVAAGGGKWLSVCKERQNLVSPCSGLEWIHKYILLGWISASQSPWFRLSCSELEPNWRMVGRQKDYFHFKLYSWRSVGLFSVMMSARCWQKYHLPHFCRWCIIISMEGVSLFLLGIKFCID